MEKEEAYDKTLMLLDDKSISTELLRKLGAQAPVNPLCLSNVNAQHEICISEDIIEDLYDIHMYTKKTGYEIPFFLYGEERQDGSVFFDNIVIGKGDSMQEADHSTIAYNLESFINRVGKSKLTNKVVCHGHTHGKGPYADNFSLHDMAAYIMMRDIHPLMKSKTIETIGCVFNSSGDLNFVLYDDYNLGFYRFPKVNVEFKDGDKKALPAYLRGNYDFVNRK